MRIGQYRVIFVVTGAMIWVTQILPRNEKTYAYKGEAMKNHHIQDNLPAIPHPVLSAGGTATHVLVPIDEYLSVFVGLGAQPAGYVFVPREVSYLVAEGESPLRAWRRHKKLTQVEMARRMSVSRPAYTQMEQSENPHLATLEKAAAALEIDIAQLVELYDDYPVSIGEE